jgi:glucosyl-dolichyl phosphate glucuronosyltransferase
MTLGGETLDTLGTKVCIMDAGSEKGASLMSSDRKAFGSCEHQVAIKISIIIPTYQRRDFLADALSSVMVQDSDQPYEILIVDNASTATSDLKVMCGQSTRPPVRYIHEPINGLHNARHAGARAARGEILVYIDDDVLCPNGWLAAMTRPFQDRDVAMVAGKVLLRYEVSPPAWLEQIRAALGELDWGDTPRVVLPYASPAGGNMSVRKSVLFAVGGFNPDGFRDPRLIHLRGDGENGLARKVYDAGYRVWYAPDAWLEHRVPASRMTPGYVEWRSAIAGIEAAYSELRYHPRSIPGLLVRSERSMLAATYHRLRANLCRHDQVGCFRHLAQASWHWHKASQQFRQALSAEVRAHTCQISYLDS